MTNVHPGVHYCTRKVEAGQESRKGGEILGRG
jgi:hypothetical protein